MGGCDNQPPQPQSAHSQGCVHSLLAGVAALVETVKCVTQVVLKRCSILGLDIKTCGGCQRAVAAHLDYFV